MTLRFIFCMAALIFGEGQLLAQTSTRRWPKESVHPHYIIHSDFQVQDGEMLRELDSVAADIRKMLGVDYGDARVHIVLFQTEREYRRYMDNYFPKLPKRRALFIQDRGPGMLFTHWHADVATDLRHEMAHALVNGRGNRPLPLWLDEGIAEYFELPAASRAAGGESGKLVLKRLLAGQFRSIGRLQQISSIAEFTDEDYLDSWAWVHLMMHRRAETRQFLVRFLQDQAAESPAYDLERGLFSLVPNLQAEVQDHFQTLAGPVHTASYRP